MRVVAVHLQDLCCNKMKEDEYQKFEELLIRAVQSGKKETSDLVDTIIHKMEHKIDEAINKSVNGKIKAIDTKIDAYIVSDNEWKEKYSPYLEGLQSVTISGKIVLWIAGFITATIGAYYAIKEFLK